MVLLPVPCTVYTAQYVYVRTQIPYYMLPAPKGIDLYPAYAVSIPVFHNECQFMVYIRKSIKKRRVAYWLLFSFFGGA